jgi:hypothetical protein
LELEVTDEPELDSVSFFSADSEDEDEADEERERPDTELLAECSFTSVATGVTTAAGTAGLGAGDSEVELESELTLDEEDLLEDFSFLSLAKAVPVIKFSLSPSIVTARGLSTDLRGAGSAQVISLGSF